MEILKLFLFVLYIGFFYEGYCSERILNATKQTRIFNGANATLGQFPFVVRLKIFQKISEGVKGELLCGGSILNKDTVLTAAHCLVDKITHKQRDETLVTVHAGGLAIEDMKTFHVLRMRIHENYDPISNNKQFDIAIIKINGTFWEDEPTSLIQPIELTNEKVPEKTKCQIIGWGETELKKDSFMYLKYASLTTLTIDECNNRRPDWAKVVVTNGMVCASSPSDNPANICGGDSGGPLVCPVNDKNRLVGITSFSIVFDCGAYFFPAVFTDVLYYRQWIEYAINNDDGFTYDNEYTNPYIVYLRYNDTIKCEGCILNKDTVLTAATCLIQHGKLKGASNITVLMDRDQSKSKNFTVKSIEIHKDFNADTRENDIGFLKMKDAFWEEKPTWKIRAIELIEEKVSKNTACLYHHVPKTIINNDDCDYNYWRKGSKRVNVTAITDGMFCGVPRDNKYLNCKYNIGGPLVCQSNAKYRLVGIASFKEDCLFNGREPAENGLPELFTDVMYYRQWIQNLTYGNNSAITTPSTGFEVLKPLTITNDSIPYAVLVVYSTNFQDKVLCIGSIVSQRKVLTAAHCLMDPNPKREFDYMFNRHQITVKTGNVYELNMKLFRVVQMERHEDCDLSSSPPLNDIAYLEVDKNFWDPYPKIYVRAIELINEKIPDNTACQVVRYYKIRNSRYYGIQYASAKMLNNDECTIKYHQKNEKHANITEEMVCALNTGSLDSCKEYKASPLICPIKNTYRLVGIESFRSENCQEGYPALFSNVMIYNNWIQYVVHHKRPSIFTNATSPYMVFVYRDDGKNPPLTCVGWFINDKVILTAAHCITIPDFLNPSKYDIVHRSYVTVYTIRIDDYNTTETKSRRMHEYLVKDMFRHAYYDSSSNPALNDIAIVKIEEAVISDEKKEDSPIYFNKLTEEEVLENERCQIVSWGEIVDKEGKMSISQINSSVKVLNYDQCTTTKYGKKYKKGVGKDVDMNSQHLCAMGTDSNYNCKNYLSGALVCPTSKGEEEEYTLAGILSSGFENCEKADYPVVMSSTMYYADWVEAILHYDTNEPLFFTNATTPYMVLVYRNDGENPQIFCSGSIINNNAVLTTASCLINNRTTNYLRNTVYVVKNYKDVMVKYGIKSINFHKNYDSSPNLPLNDIAIIQIDGDFKMSQIIELANEEVSGEEECEIFRWGKFNRWDLSIPQYTSTVKILYHDKCEKYGKKRKIENDQITSGMICAVTTKANYKCEDYSGGSLVCPINGMKRLVGVSSFGVGNCEKNSYPSIFSDVMYYQKWITEVLPPGTSTHTTCSPTTSPPYIIKSTAMSFTVLVINFAHQPNIVCGGAIVGQDTVITAAHCLMNVSKNNSNRPEYNLVSVENIRVMAGDEKENIYLVKRMDYHEGYNASTNPPLNDMAYIIIVDSFWSMSAHIMVIKSIELCNEEVLESTKCQVFQRELERYHKDRDVKFKPATSVSIIDDNRCIKEFQKFPELNVQIIKDNKIYCVNRPVVRHLCNYAGGPLVCLINGTNCLAGIASYDRYVVKNVKYFSTPVIFSDVNYYRQWIQDIIVDRDEKYSHTVLIKIRNNYNNKVKVCAGSAIKHFKILAAAHCFMPFDPYDSLKYDIKVLGGDVREWKMQEFHVRKVRPHKDYDSSKHPLNDIAYVEIRRTRWSENLWLPHLEIIKIKNDKIPKNSQCQVMGWGTKKIPGRKSMYELNFISVEIIGRRKCENLLGINITESMICIVIDDDDNNYGCQDISSGPLVCKINEELFLVGIAPELSNCRRASSNPTVFINIVYYKEWINKMIADPIDTDALTRSSNDDIDIDTAPQTTSSKPAILTLFFMGFFIVLITVGILAIADWLIRLVFYRK